MSLYTKREQIENLLNVARYNVREARDRANGVLNLLDRLHDLLLEKQKSRKKASAK